MPMRTPESNYAAGLSEKSSLTLFDLVLAFYLPVSILYGHVGVGLALFLLLLLAFGIELSSRQYRPHNAPRLACVACSACLVILGVLHSLPMTDPLAVSRISVMVSNWVLMAVLLVRTSVGFSAWVAEAGLASTLLLIVAASWCDPSIVES